MQTTVSQQQSCINVQIKWCKAKQFQVEQLQSDLAQYEVAYQELETNRNELVSACFVSFLCTQSKIVSLLLQTELQSEYSKITFVHVTTVNTFCSFKPD